MTSTHLTTLLLVLVAFGAANSPIAHGEDIPPVKLTIYPAKAPIPALRYQLLPEFSSRIRGNAAVYYGKVTAENSYIFGNRELLDKLEAWREAPLADLRAKDVVMPAPQVEQMLARAARCESCDWQLPVHEEVFYTMLLPEVQQTRGFARILATSVRISIARGNYDEAMTTFQSSFALARFVAEGETVVNGLVGIAIEGMLLTQVFEFVQQPDAPNLYWALTMLPRPLVDLRAGIEAERAAKPLSLIGITDLRDRRTPEEWSALLELFWEKVIELGGFEANSIDVGTPPALAERSLATYDTAKHALIDGGADSEFVASMAPAQAVLNHLLQEFDRRRDEVMKWFFVPPADSREILNDVTLAYERAVADSSIAAVLAKAILPFTSAVMRAERRVEREVALLRLVEALRIYAADHEGRLPEKLADCTAVPIPVDPLTLEPFDYRVADGVAIIEVSPLPGKPTRYEIKLQNR